MPNPVFFSVIIPTYNRADLIVKSIQSVLQQTYTDFELIIVDDGSSDNTQEQVSSIHDTRIHYFKIKNSERGAARNFGVQKCKGSFTTFLDSDDQLSPIHLMEAASYLSHNSETSVFHLGYDVVNPSGKVQVRWRPLPNPVNKKLHEGNYLSCLGVFVKREVLIEFPFNEDRNLSGSEDYELWLRLSARFPIHTIPKITAQLVNHSARSVVTMDINKIIHRVDLFKKYVQAEPAVVAYLGRNIKKVFAYMDLYLALHLAMSNNPTESIKNLVHSFSSQPDVFFNKRFWVVLKKLIIGK